MAAHDPTQLPGAARGPVPGNGAGHPLQPQPLRPMPVPIQPVPVGNGVHPQPVAAAPQSPLARAPMPVLRPAQQPMAPQPLAPQPVSAVQRPAPQPALRPAPILVPAGTVMPRASDMPEEDEQPALEEVVKKNAPPWLISMSIQMLLVLSLGLWSMPQDKKPQELSVAEYSDQEGDDLGLARDPRHRDRRGQARA